MLCFRLRTIAVFLCVAVLLELSEADVLINQRDDSFFDRFTGLTSHVRKARSRQNEETKDDAYESGKEGYDGSQYVQRSKEGLQVSETKRHETDSNNQNSRSRRNEGKDQGEVNNQTDKNQDSDTNRKDNTDKQTYNTLLTVLPSGGQGNKGKWSCTLYRCRPTNVTNKDQRGNGNARICPLVLNLRDHGSFARPFPVFVFRNDKPENQKTNSAPTDQVNEQTDDGKSMEDKRHQGVQTFTGPMIFAPCQNWFNQGRHFYTGNPFSSNRGHNPSVAISTYRTNEQNEEEVLTLYKDKDQNGSSVQTENPVPHQNLIAPGAVYTLNPSSFGPGQSPNAAFSTYKAIEHTKEEISTIDKNKLQNAASVQTENPVPHQNLIAPGAVYTLNPSSFGPGQSPNANPNAALSTYKAIEHTKEEISTEDKNKLQNAARVQTANTVPHQNLIAPGTTLTGYPFSFQQPCHFDFGCNCGSYCDQPYFYNCPDNFFGDPMDYFADDFFSPSFM
ncbi:uncharacterized protein LOC106665080 isoform X1 [Cimex lectularius]|uniref:Uncharacterized protein n=1 Tax=Cimex lectularius TaxID=79782 RepID=A0A8I6RMS8_CIMLE|nr:uncharacterized protein LOC106665080 isoform X1 [Cimex lectularius]